MAQQSFASIAVLIALTFAVMALHGCANTAQRAANGPVTATAEFHDASIGRDALRARLGSDD